MTDVDLTQQEEAYFQKMFHLYDTDKSGAIGLSELRNLAHHLGVELSDDALMSSVRSIGCKVEEGDFDLSFDQFVEWLLNAQATGDEFALLKAKITAQGMKALTNEQINRLKDVFDYFDVDGSGSIDADELVVMFASMGQSLTRKEAEELIDGVDDDGSGQIEFGEFMVLMCGKFGSHTFEEDMREAFEEADPKNSGVLSTEAMQNLMKEKSGGILTDQEISQIIGSINSVRADGMIEYMKWEPLWEACREEVE